MTQQEKVLNYKTAGEIFEINGVRILIEQIEYEGRQAYLVHRYGDHDKDDYEIVTQYQKSETLIYIPVEPSYFQKLNEPVEFENYEDVYNEVVSYIKAHTWYQNESMYYVYASWLIATWIYEKFDSFPYVQFLGDLATGKTRDIEIGEQIAHRAIMTPNASESVFFRIMHAWHPTLFYDESEGLNQETKQAIIPIVNSGYKKGGVVFRGRMTSDNYVEVDGFKVYGPKGFGGTKGLTETLESRCIRFPKVEKPKNAKLNPNIDKVWAFKIRNKLLSYRLLNVGTPFEGFLDMGVVSYRIMELFTPLLFVTPESFKHHIATYAQKTERILDGVRGESIAFPILQAILRMKDGIDPTKNKLRLSVIKEDIILHDFAFVDGKPLTEKFIGKKLREIGLDNDCFGRDKESTFIRWDDKFNVWLKNIIPQYFKDQVTQDEMLAKIGVDPQGRL